MLLLLLYSSELFVSPNTLGIPLFPSPPPDKPDYLPDGPLEPWCVQGPKDDPGGRAEGAGTPQQPVRHSGASKSRN